MAPSTNFDFSSTTTDQDHSKGGALPPRSRQEQQALSPRGVGIEALAP
jgi:hypothetical protein